MPPSICARMTFGLTGTPQSTAHQTLCTRGRPSLAIRNLGDLGDIGVEALVHGDAARPSLGHGPPQSAISATRFRTPTMARARAEQAEPALDRILARRRQELVDEASRW